jgi:hypothetical protein
MKRRTYEDIFGWGVMRSIYIIERSECNELGELTVQLEELGIKFRKQFYELEQFSIQLEKQ